VKYVGKKEAKIETALLKEFSRMKELVDKLIFKISSLRS